MDAITRREILRRAGIAGGAVAAGGLLVPSLGHARTLRAASGSGTWLPGDLHTHSTYSHDVYGGPTDANTGPDELYTAGLPVAGKFLEGRARGLRFLAVSDHDDVRSLPELTSASGDVIAIPAYETSIEGHAQMLGARREYAKGDRAADAINAMAGELRTDGGVFQANHPAYRLDGSAELPSCSPTGGCADCRGIHWKYGFDVRPDTIEVWNPSVVRSDISETYWECWLDRGERVAGTGGSDSHWASLHAVAGPGQPTTWVYAREASTAGILEGLREGRTVVSGQPPSLGGAQVMLEAPGEGIVGDTVAPGTPMRVSAPGLASPGVVRLRSNGRQILEEEIAPGETIDFRAPADAGWVRAVLLARPALPVSGSTPVGDATPSRDGMLMLALSSPMYLRRPDQGSRLPGSRAA